MRKEQLVRGHVKPKVNFSIHQIPKAERDSKPAASGDAWWVAHSKPSAPPRSEFVAEVTKRQAERIDTSRAAALRRKDAPKPKPETRPVERQCEVCPNKFVLNLRGPNARYCSHACNQRAWKQRRKSA